MEMHAFISAGYSLYLNVKKMNVMLYLLNVYIYAYNNTDVTRPIFIHIKHFLFLFVL